MVGYTLGRGVRPVRCAKGIIDKNLGIPSQSTGKIGIVRLFLGVKTSVFKKQDLTRLQCSPGSLSPATDTLISKGNLFAQQLTQTRRGRTQ